MTSQRLQYVLADGRKRFLAHKRALGRRYDTEAYALRLLDRFLTKHAVTSYDEITAELLDGFLKSRPRHQPRSFNHLLGVVRRFFDWLVVQGEIEKAPTLPRRRRETVRRLPFILDASQARSLLALAEALPESPRAPLRGPTYRMVFGLLYGLGMRVGEVTRLCFADIDRERRLLVIRRTKFAKSRFVPCGPRVWAAIQQYIGLVEERRGPYSADAPVFSFIRGRPVSRGSIGRTFRHLVSELCFEVQRGTATPRVHDLRHSFAVGTLLRWYQRGLDPGQRLLHLSTFLGHVQPESTAVYLTITEALFREAGDRFERFALPTIGGTTS